MKDFNFNREAVKAQHGSEVCSALDEFYSLYTARLTKWIASMWDKESGGFYFSRSAKQTEGFYADIESTGQAIGVIQDLGLTPDPYYLPEQIRCRVVEFLREKQDPDGFFYHPQWGKDISTSRRARDLASASWIIEGFGSSLKYPSALKQMEKAASGEGEYDVPEHLRSKEAFLAYLDGLDINRNSYPAGQIIGMQAPQIKAVGLDKVCIDYLNSKQYESGIWESELNYTSANGVLKICHAYNALGADIPRLPLVVEAVLTTALSKDEPVAIVDVFNPLMAVHFLRNIISNTGRPERMADAERIIKSKAVELIRLTADKLRNFLCSDGAFSYTRIDAPRSEFSWSQGKIVAPAAIEGDMNATQLARATQILLTEALMLPVGAPYTLDDADEFFGLFGT